MIVIDFLEGVVLNYVECIVILVQEGFYDDVIFYCVIEGFMVQMGDVQFGKVGGDKWMVGCGGLSYFDLVQEFFEVLYEWGMVGMVCS